MNEPQLNRNEQAHVDRLAELEQHRHNGTRFINDYQLAEAKKAAEMARDNAATRAQRLADLAHVRQVWADAEEARRQQRIAAEIDAVKQQARRGFTGTDAAFEAAWSKILAAWHIPQSLAALEGGQSRGRSPF